MKPETLGARMAAIRSTVIISEVEFVSGNPMLVDLDYVARLAVGTRYNHKIQGRFRGQLKEVRWLDKRYDDGKSLIGKMLREKKQEVMPGLILDRSVSDPAPWGAYTGIVRTFTLFALVPAAALGKQGMEIHLLVLAQMDEESGRIGDYAVRLWPTIEEFWKIYPMFADPHADENKGAAGFHGGNQDGPPRPTVSSFIPPPDPEPAPVDPKRRVIGVARTYMDRDTPGIVDLGLPNLPARSESESESDFRRHILSAFAVADLIKELRQRGYIAHRVGEPCESFKKGG